MVNQYLPCCNNKVVISINMKKYFPQAFPLFSGIIMTILPFCLIGWRKFEVIYVFLGYGAYLSLIFLYARYDKWRNS